MKRPEGRLCKNPPTTQQLVGRSPNQGTSICTPNENIPLTTEEHIQTYLEEGVDEIQ